jgi:hypothetical protein
MVSKSIPLNTAVSVSAIFNTSKCLASSCSEFHVSTAALHLPGFTGKQYFRETPFHNPQTRSYCNRNLQNEEKDPYTFGGVRCKIVAALLRTGDGFDSRLGTQ